MAKEVFIELFRFNHKTDYLPYFKKYTMMYEKNDKLIDLLNNLNKIEKFDFDNTNVCNLKINNLYLTSEELVSSVVKKTSKTLEISPVSTKRALNDLIINQDDFLQKINIFDDYLTKEQKEDYFNKYQLEYYASNTLNFNDSYIGDHALLIADDIINSNPELKNKILDIIADKNNGIWYHTSLKNKIFNYDNTQEEIIQNLFKMLPDFSQTQVKKEIESLEEITNISQNFLNFNIASYDGINGNSLESIIKQSKANFINLVSKNDDLALCSKIANKNFSLKIAGNILLEAKDKNADFIMVNNEEDILVFDKEQKNIEKTTSREINIPVISKNQFIRLLNGEKNPTKLGFDLHKIKISFL